MCVCPFQSHTNFVVSHPIWGVKVPAVQPIVEDPFRTTAAGVRENPRSSFPCQGQSAQPVRLGRGGTGRTKLLIELHEFHVFSYACLKWLGKSTWEHVDSTFLDFCFIFFQNGCPQQSASHPSRVRPTNIAWCNEDLALVLHAYAKVGIGISKTWQNDGFCKNVVVK